MSGEDSYLYVFPQTTIDSQSKLIRYIKKQIWQVKEHMY